MKILMSTMTSLNVASEKPSRPTGLLRAKAEVLEKLRMTKTKQKKKKERRQGRLQMIFCFTVAACTMTNFAATRTTFLIDDLVAVRVSTNFSYANENEIWTSAATPVATSSSTHALRNPDQQNYPRPHSYPYPDRDRENVKVNVNVLDELIDYSNSTSNIVKKGFKKVLFHHKHNRSVGFLIANEINNVSDYENYQNGFDLAFNLATDYPTIPHFHLQRPYVIPSITPKQASRLNSKLKKPRFTAKSLVHVQKVLLAPVDHIIIGCIRPKFKHPDSITKLKHYIIDRVINFNISNGSNTNTRSNDSNNTTAIVLSPQAKTSLEIFYKNLQINLQLVKEMIQKKQYKCLIYDFQFVVDTQGHFFHIDIDRCFPKRRARERPFKICVSNLNSMVSTIFNDYTSSNKQVF